MSLSGKRVSSRLAQKALSQPPPPPPLPVQAPPITSHDEDEDVEIYEDYDELDEEDEYDSEAEAQAEAMAQQMTDQLAAEIGKIYHFKSDGTVDPIAPVMRHLLALAENEPRLQSALEDTRISEAGSQSILDLLLGYLNHGQLSDNHTLALSRALLNLLQTPLVDDLEPSPVTGKRKRDQADSHPPPPVPSPFSNALSSDIEARIKAAADAIHRELQSTLSASSSSTSLPPTLKPQLGQIYQFTTTYADAADPSSSSLLREISKLIKDTDILDRSQLAYPPVVDKDTSTAVFPCYRHPCKKLFASTAMLTAHGRTHTAGGKLPLKTTTPAITLQYQCDACKSLFPGRDALRRHQETAGPACTDAAANVIEHRQEAAASGATHEDGEVDPKMLVRAQGAVVRLLSPLRERAERARAAANANRKPEDDTVLELDELGGEVRRTPATPAPVTTPAPAPAPVLSPVPLLSSSSTVAAPSPDIAKDDVPATPVPPPDTSPKHTIEHDPAEPPEMETDAKEENPPLEQDESNRLEEEMMKMMEAAQAEAEAEVMMDMSDIEVDIEGDGDEDEDEL
ncbi:hypothetical protein DL93DRAFT_1032849 [Clavulina sp. PMI_390]|nr:hypothetical protein DL93DRAFT_1032849 [Clavulina sp. PMI_390]